MIKEKLNQIISGKLTAQENLKEFLEKIEKDNKKNNINAFTHLNKNSYLDAKEVDKKIQQQNNKAGKLAGLVVAVKSNICVKNLITNCASKTLENYTAPYNATVIEKLKKEGIIIIGMTNCDEFASGSSGETSAFGPTKNPTALDRIPGGSSSGSAAAVSADFCDFALGSDTGGSIRNPASHCGIVGFKPSYGAVSRYGLIDLSMSLDTIGILARSIEDVKIVFEIIQGIDEKEATTQDIKKLDLKKIKNIKIGTIDLKTNEKIKELIKKRISKVSNENKYTYKKINLNYLNLGIQTYYPINYVEFFSGTRKFDGRRFGKKIEESCGEEVLRRIEGGREISKSEYKGRYYKKALEVKELIKKEFENAFKEIDCIIIPTVPKLPHKLNEKITIEDMYNYDALTVLANLAEIPAISIPAGKINNIPVGMQILCAKGEDRFLLEIAQKFELKD